MKYGKKVCELLNDIRKQIAEDNGIEYTSTPCSHEEDCLGTCPLCDKELKGLQEAIDYMLYCQEKIVINKRKIDNIISEKDNRQIQRLAGCPAPIYTKEESNSNENKTRAIDDLPF